MHVSDALSNDNAYPLTRIAQECNTYQHAWHADVPKVVRRIGHAPLQ